MKKRIKSVICGSKPSRPMNHHIFRLLLPSFLGMILCMVCLAQTTWAWFSANVQTQPQTIEAANYDITILIEDENKQPIEKTEQGYFLSANSEYKVTLTAGGTAPSGGYCVVHWGENASYTEQILPGEMLSFILVPGETVNYTLTAMWGSYSGEPNITDNCMIGQKVEMLPIPEETESQPDSENQAESSSPEAIPQETLPVPEETSPTPEETSPTPEATSPTPEATSPAPEESSPTQEETSPMPEATSPTPEETSQTLEGSSSISGEIKKSQAELYEK